VLPISEYLISHVKSVSKNKPIFKLPPLFDFNLVGNDHSSDQPFFLFCGSAGFHDVVVFIIESFEILDDPDFYLYLVISGDPIELNRLRKRIDSSKKNNKIKLLSDLSFQKLISLYLQAKGLLIPLRSNLRDSARFPQKIAEYVASGNPVISTNEGEMKHYFSDGISALLAQKYDISLFSEKMKFVVSNPELAAKIGEHGKKIGLDHFHYETYKERLPHFLTQVLNSKKNRS
jgi:glycosyltransferase involved in cell wall biosynthesis